MLKLHIHSKTEYFYMTGCKVLFSSSFQNCNACLKKKINVYVHTENLEGNLAVIV